LKYILLFVVFAGIVLVVVSVGYVAGRNKASDYDKTKKAEYKEMSGRVSTLVIQKSEAETEAFQYRSALESIAAGKGGAPEITASAVLSLYKK
jgi:hypothetical protein